MKEGNIIFLTRRKGSWYNPRVLLSYIIATLSTKDKSRIDIIATHTAIIYKKDDVFYVRDMDNDGNSSYTLDKYKELYKGRIKIKEHSFHSDFIEFNERCEKENIEYDFFNLLFFQSIKSIFGIFIGRNTIKHRICSEDTARMFNVIFEYFKKPEEITPVQIDYLTNDWNVIWKG